MRADRNLAPAAQTLPAPPVRPSLRFEFRRAPGAGRSRRPAPPSSRVSTASAPCPTAGHMTAGSSNSVMRFSQPRRRSPAEASTIASYWPSSSLRKRVSTLPRMSSISKSGRSARSCAARRSELVPTRAPAARSASRAPTRHRADLRAPGIAASVKPAGKIGRHIFQAVDRQVDRAGEQRLLDFLGEQALGPDLRKRDVGDLVAGGVDDLDAATPAQASASRA